jgi:hypothetical protein
MKTIITASAPSAYQMTSLHAFGLNIKPHAYDSGATGTLEFSTRKAAREHLQKRAQMYNETYGTEENLRAMFKDIKKGFLSIDAVTAYIQ